VNLNGGTQIYRIPATERRFAVERRRRVAEMSAEEMRQELLTSEVTRLPNRRAFEEAGPALAVAISDVDALKAVNKYGYMAGDAVLTAKADSLRKAGLEAYYDKGDEFLCRGHDVEDLILTRKEIGGTIAAICWGSKRRFRFKNQIGCRNSKSAAKAG
jgi:GGDEF domain-containing protein